MNYIIYPKEQEKGPIPVALLTHFVKSKSGTPSNKMYIPLDEIHPSFVPESRSPWTAQRKSRRQKTGSETFKGLGKTSVQTVCTMGHYF